MRDYWNGSSTQLSLGHANSLREWGIAGMEAQPINSPARRQPTRPGQQNHRAKGKQKLTKTNLSIKSGVARIPLSCGTPARRDNCINNYKKKKWTISLTPQTLVTFADTPLTFKNSHLPPLNFQKFSLTPHPYKLGHKFLKKDKNTPVFYFLKK
jgi:hypothetical protein